MPTLFARGSDGTVCIYTGAADVVDNPDLAPARVLFHSNRLYPKVIGKVTGSITLPAVAVGGGYHIARSTSYNLFAHGRPGFPMILATAVLTLQDATPIVSPLVPMVGSVPVGMNATGYCTWLTLGADATNVVLHERMTSNGSARSSILVSYTVRIFDVLL